MITKFFKEYKFPILLVAILFFALIGFLTITEIQINRIYLEYPLIYKKDSLNQTIKSIYNNETDVIRDNNTVVHLELDNNNKITISTNYSDNYKKGIKNLLNTGDRIVKYSGSDTVYIYKHFSSATIPEYVFFLDTVQYVKPIKK